VVGELAAAELAVVVVMPAVVETAAVLAVVVLAVVETAVAVARRSRTRTPIRAAGRAGVTPMVRAAAGPARSDTDRAMTCPSRVRPASRPSV